MRRHPVLPLLAATCLLASCNQPAVTPKPPAFQNSENTVRDWNNVAHQIADRMAELGYLPDAMHPPAPGAPPPWPIFIREQAPDSAFIHAVAGELTATVLRRGGTIARTPAGATVVNLDVDFVRWGPRDKPPGLTTTLLPFLLVPGPGSDLIVATTATMNAEAIWQASIITPDRVMMALQKPVYIRAPDIPLYAKAMTLTPLPSWADTAPLSARVIRYDP
jgi:hypothetical protein